MSPISVNRTETFPVQLELHSCILISIFTNQSKQPYLDRSGQCFLGQSDYGIWSPHLHENRSIRDRAGAGLLSIQVSSPRGQRAHSPFSLKTVLPLDGAEGVSPEPSRALWLERGHAASHPGTPHSHALSLSCNTIGPFHSRVVSQSNRLH